MTSTEWTRGPHRFNPEGCSRCRDIRDDPLRELARAKGLIPKTDPVTVEHGEPEVLR